MPCAWNRHRLLGLVLVLLLACGKAERPRPVPLAHPAAERAVRLAPGLSPEIVLKGGETRAYLFDLPSGWLADLVVEQKGIDVEVSLSAADGRRLAGVDSPNGAWGPEPLPFVAGAAGEYRLEIRSSPGAAPGRVQVRLAPPRPATPADRSRAAAERAFAEGTRLSLGSDGGSLLQAIDRYREALGGFQGLGDRAREADSLVALGRLCFLRGDSAAALAAYQQALPLLQGAERRRDLPDALNGLGLAHRALGDTLRAREDLREALAVSRSAGDLRAEAETLTNLGRTYDVLGETQDALQAHERSAELWRRLHRPGDEALALLDLGRLYLAAGAPERAIDQIREALPLLESADQHLKLAGALDDLGKALWRTGHAAEGLAPLERARAIQVRLGNRRGEAVALNDLGRLRESMGQRGEAWRLYSLARDRFRELGDPAGESSPLQGLARLQEARGDAGAAADLYAQALRRLEAAANPAGQAGALLGLARCRRLQGDLAGARTLAESALVRVESLRGKPVSLELRTSFLASQQELYELYVDTLMELHRRQPAAGYDRLAFEACERSRARGLLDTLEEGRGGQGPIAPELLARESELARQLNEAGRRRSSLVAAGAPPAQAEAAERSLRRLLAESGRLRDRIRRASLGSSAQVQARPAGLAEIQRRLLDRDTVLLEIALGRERSYLWAVTPSSLASFELPPRAGIETAARQAYRLLTTRQRTLARAETQRALAGLSRLLLAPAAGQIGPHRLLVAADGALSYLPFAALPAPGSGEPLVASHEIVTAPSASSLLALRRERRDRRPPPAAVAVVADPVFEAGDPRVHGGRAAAPASLRGASQRLARLPFSRAEAETIRSLAPPGGTLVALDFAASRETVLSGALARYRIVHFATHGVLDTAHPELSGLLLSGVDRQGRPVEGFLGAHEIDRLRLPADLVVLSGCETALGREIRGEGLVGLTRAFLHAGARRVVVSLWPVQDQATAELMRRFYRGMLRDGLPPAAALRAAQAGLRGEPSWRDPYFWAGFVLQGDWR